MRVIVHQTICKDLLEQFLKDHARGYIPLPPSTTNVLMCDKISDVSQLARHGQDTGVAKDYSVFLDYHVTFAMSEVPAKRFTFTCFHPIEHQRHHHVEFEYYNNPKILTSSFNAKWCAYCAGSSGADEYVNNEESNYVWKSVVHVCQERRANGALPIARSRSRNGAHIDKRAQRRRLTATAS